MSTVTKACALTMTQRTADGDEDDVEKVARYGIPLIDVRLRMLTSPLQ